MYLVCRTIGLLAHRTIGWSDYRYNPHWNELHRQKSYDPATFSRDNMIRSDPEIEWHKWKQYIWSSSLVLLGEIDRHKWKQYIWSSSLVFVGEIEWHKWKQYIWSSSLVFVGEIDWHKYIWPSSLVFVGEIDWHKWKYYIWSSCLVCRRDWLTQMKAVHMIVQSCV
jgi:hypothetical protein